jgi:hypothetical protein
VFPGCPAMRAIMIDCATAPSTNGPPAVSASCAIAAAASCAVVEEGNS